MLRIPHFWKLLHQLSVPSIQQFSFSEIKVPGLFCCCLWLLELGIVHNPAQEDEVCTHMSMTQTIWMETIGMQYNATRKINFMFTCICVYLGTLFLNNIFYHPTTHFIKAHPYLQPHPYPTLHTQILTFNHCDFDRSFKTWPCMFPWTYSWHLQEVFRLALRKLPESLRQLN